MVDSTPHGPNHTGEKGAIAIAATELSSLARGTDSWQTDNDGQWKSVISSVTHLREKLEPIRRVSDSCRQIQSSHPTLSHYRARPALGIPESKLAFPPYFPQTFRTSGPRSGLSEVDVVLD